MTAAGNTEEMIAALEVQRIAAMQSNDLDAIAAFIHDECVYTHSPGDRDTRDTYLDKCRSGIIRYHRLGTTIEKIILRGDVAIVLAVMDGDAEWAGTPRKLRNCYTAVWTRDSGTWQVITFQPTPILT